MMMMMDILAVQEFQNTEELRLMDINEESLQMISTCSEPNNKVSR